ncbi:MAG: NAD-dependent epimerase/dehydratase family protein [Alphaproteobacteria bacterium]
MHIAILGGDGFVGWPTALHLSDAGYNITIIDNLSRRNIDAELHVESLTPIAPIQERIKAWHEVSGKEIKFQYIDIATDYDGLKTWLAQNNPDSIIHFAEQRAAPYSMKSPAHKRYTVNNNTGGTHNLLCAITELGLDPHIVHLGTMGVYGYSSVGIQIPEGYLTVKMNKEADTWVEQDILYPANPGSIYHMTKCLDQLLFQYYAKNDNLRVTDLHQGIVWGTNTKQTALDERLINRFDYDGDYGTVLNRFLMQAAIGYPLSVHGSGGQTRAFIHIQDSVRCIEIAVKNPPQKSDRVKIFNQMTETHTVRNLANLIAEMTGVEVQNVHNPRKEAAENDLDVANAQFLALGLQPITLKEGLLSEIMDIAKKYKDRVNTAHIPCTSAWTTDISAELKANV